jgi:hypothetical protein
MSTGEIRSVRMSERIASIFVNVLVVLGRRADGNSETDSGSSDSSEANGSIWTPVKASSSGEVSRDGIGALPEGPGRAEPRGIIRGVIGGLNRRSEVYDVLGVSMESVGPAEKEILDGSGLSLDAAKTAVPGIVLGLFEYCFLGWVFRASKLTTMVKEEATHCLQVLQADRDCITQIQSPNIVSRRHGISNSDRPVCLSTEFIDRPVTGLDSSKLRTTKMGETLATRTRGAALL